VLLNVNEESVLKDIRELRGLFDTLKYEKIILRVATKKDILLKLNNLNETNYIGLKKLKNMSKEEKKEWRIVPLFMLDSVLLELKEEELFNFYKICKNLFVCAVSYSKVVETDEFNPAISIENVATDFSVDNLISDEKYETPDGFNFIMNELMGKWLDADMQDKMNNVGKELNEVTDEKLNIASDSIKNLLREETQSSSTDIISIMLDKIKDEVGNLKNNNENLTGKDGMKQLYSIGKKISEQMGDSMMNDNVNPMDLLTTSFNMIRKTTSSNKNIDNVEKLIKMTVSKQINEKILEEIKRDVETETL
jgi:hypothetical protein